jgi:hypothetical protein
MGANFDLLYDGAPSLLVFIRKSENAHQERVGNDDAALVDSLRAVAQRAAAQRVSQRQVLYV